MICRFLAVLALAVAAPAQTTTPVTTDSGAPAASVPPALPATQVPAAVQQSGPLPNAPVTPVTLPPITQLPPDLLADEIPANATALTLAQAEQLALANNPQITAAKMLALAEAQVTREQRAAELPTLAANLTAVYADNGTRLTAGALNNPVLYQRAAAGVTLTQLITDFGRVHNLVASAHLRADASDSAFTFARDSLVFAVDQAFYRALGAQALITVARQTIQTRQATANQIQALANANLRSTLDASFANSALAQAQLLLVDARNQNAAAQAALTALLGPSSAGPYKLVDETAVAPPPAPKNTQALLDQAFATRTDLKQLQQQAEAAERFRRAERDLKLPTITALGAAGDAPARASQITDQAYGAVGVNVNIPIFNGGLNTAREKEASFRAAAAQAQVTLLRDNIRRDITTTVLQAQSNYDRIAVAQQLAQQADAALSFAQSRYNLGLSSVVELSQAQLLQTQAQTELINARFTYQGSLSAVRFQTGQ